MLGGLTELPLYFHPPGQIPSACVFLCSWWFCWFALGLVGWIFFVVIVFVEELWGFLVGFLFVCAFPQNPSVLLLFGAGKRSPTLAESLGTEELSNTLIHKP